jgi:HlyD family secretion protein
MNTKKIIAISLVIIMIILIVAAKSCKKNDDAVSLETSRVKIGNVSNTITATGTLEATRTISVGTQVSGVIDKIYVDYNSQVKAGQLLAELDKRTLITSLENAQANLENAEAEMTFQTSNYNRLKALSDKKLVSQNDYDQALYSYSKAQATLKAAKLEYNRAKINLNYASIYSPIAGIVLERAVDEGQTVAASFNTPTLFSIANDLTQMQVEASIDEADIGKLINGQKVTFTVDAFPEMQFAGQIIQIRLQPVIKSNVVTYTVVVKAPNPDMKLKPGMTANITVFVEEALNVLTIPSKALRFTPDQNLISSYMAKNDKANGSKAEVQVPSLPTLPDSTYRNIWIKNDKGIFPIPVKIGIDDDINAQIISGIKEGDEVILSMTGSSKSLNTNTPTGSPFMPKPPSKSNSTSGKEKS